MILAATLSEWRETGQEISVKITSPQGEVAAGALFLRRWTPQQRLRRALMALGVCWSLALFSVLVPVLHFVLVPAFFLLGLLISLVLYQQTVSVLGGEGQCPRCGSPLKLEGGRMNWPLKDLCTNCQTQVHITPS